MTTTREEAQMPTITLTETNAPSRSKGRGWLRIDGWNGSFATTTGRAFEAEIGDELTLVTGVELRRAQRGTERERRVLRVVVTGMATDVVLSSIGSPSSQSYDVAITGVRTP